MRFCCNRYRRRQKFGPILAMLNFGTANTFLISQAKDSSDPTDSYITGGETALYHDRKKAWKRNLKPLLQMLANPNVLKIGTFRQKTSFELQYDRLDCDPKNVRCDQHAHDLLGIGKNKLLPDLIDWRLHPKPAAFTLKASNPWQKICSLRKSSKLNTKKHRIPVLGGIQNVLYLHMLKDCKLAG